MNLVRIFSIILFSLPAQASFQRGIGLELNIGYPQLTASLSNTEARYTGLSLGGQLILPLLDYEGSFSMDLTLGYQYANYQNTASTSVAAEWSQIQGFHPGLRFNLKYFFLGTEVYFLDGRHLVAGNNSEVFDYTMNPLLIYGGAHIAVNDSLSLALSYKQHLIEGSTTINAQSLTINEQVVMLSLQFDLGIGFFNVIEDDSTFKFLDGTEF